MKYGNEVVSTVEAYEDVRATYETNHMPKYLKIEEKKSEVKVQIQNQRIKMYVMKDMDIVNNIDSIYAKIWGKFTEPLHNMTKYLDEFTVNTQG